MEIEFITEIDPEKKRHECHAALAFGSATTLALLLVGLCCPPLWLCLVGLWVLLIPASFDRYRTMRRQSILPDTLRIQGELLLYCTGTKPCFSIPLSAISRLEFRGGIRLFLRGEKKMTLLNPHFSLAKFMAKSKRQQCDLFFAWFDLSAKTRLEDIVHTNQAYNASFFEHR